MASSYPYPSEVDVKKFVTVKLSKTNYLTWKPLMLRLIKEQGLEGFINGDVSAESKMIEVPSDDSSTMIKQKNPKYEDWKNSNKLLKKWIIDTLSTDDDIHTLVKRHRMAKIIWANLEKYYNPFSYPYPSSEVNVEKFVTIKLSKINYFTWKTPMLRLIKRHGLEGFINGDISKQPKMIKVPSGDGSRMIKKENPIHEYWKRSDDLLKDWILHTLSSDDDIYIVEHSRSVKKVWEKLEKQHTTETRKNQTQYLPLIKAIVDGDWVETQEFLKKYPDAIRAPITNFSSTPLLVAAESGKRNHLVRELVHLMLPDDLAHADQSGCTALHVAARGGNIEVATLLVEKNPQLPYVLNAYEELPVHFAASNGHKDMVVYLLGVTKEDTEPTTIEHELGTKLVNDPITGELYAHVTPKVNCSSYPYPLEVNVEKHVTVKLSKINYFRWKTQMSHLIKRHRLEGFINGDIAAQTQKIIKEEKPKYEKNPKYEKWKKSDDLLKEWIRHTLSSVDDIHIVEHSRTVKRVWEKLEKQHTTEMRKNQTQYLPLIKAIVDGDWVETQEFLKKYPDAIRTPITNFSSTPLLVAAESGKRNHLVRELVDQMLPDDLAHADQSGCTALHVAARGGNTEVAKLLVEKNPQLPYVLNAYEELPLHVAASNGHKDMVVYLLGVTKKDTEPNTFEHKLGTKLVNDLITGELYGIALFVVQHNLKLACGYPSPLEVLAKKPSAFRSGAHLNFRQRLIYRCVPKLEENINVSAKLFVPDDPTHVENSNTNSRDRGDVVSANSSVPNVRMHVENFENHSTDRRDINHANGFVPNDPTNVENIENCSTDREDINSDNILVPRTSKTPYDIPTQMENTENYSTNRGDIESANSVDPSVPTHGENFENHSTEPSTLSKMSFPYIKDMREKKLIHYQSEQLVKVLCSDIVKLEFPKNFKKIGEPLRIAAKDGVHEVVENIIDSFPTAIYSGYAKGQTIFHDAIVNRREKVFNLLYKFGEHYKRLLSDVDESGNNCLHLAGYLESKGNFNLKVSAAGAALQMQRELQWFKEVERLLPNQDKDKKNNDKKTAAELFTETHLKLVEGGEKWMKDTANSCIIVATLVVTIMFAAAITVPGGNNGDTGLPFFATKTAFIVFAISNALALFSSTSSVLMFLSILTSRYAQNDFLSALPKRLIIGLVTLFVSILCMMIAFAATLEILFGDNYPWIFFPVVALACIPVLLFGFLQFPLLVDMIKSTCGPGIFGKQHNCLLSKIYYKVICNTK